MGEHDRAKYTKFEIETAPGTWVDISDQIADWGKPQIVDISSPSNLLDIKGMCGEIEITGRLLFDTLQSYLDFFDWVHSTGEVDTFISMN